MTLDNAVIRRDGDVGKVQESLVTIDDNGSMNIPSGETYDIDGSPHTHTDNGMVLIDSATPSGVDMVSFTSIPGTYKKLIIEYVGRSDKSANFESMTIAFNTDTTATNYRYSVIYVTAAGTVAGAGGDTPAAPAISAASAPAGSCGAGKIEIPFYSGSTFRKQARCISSYRYDASSTHQATFYASMEWENTAAITQIDITLASGDFVAGSEFRLYGVP